MKAKKTKLGNTPLHLVVEAGGPHATQCAGLLLEAKADPEAKGSTEIGASKTCLHYAVQSYNKNDNRQEKLAMIELLLEHKASPNITDKVGMTPMHLAARKGAAEIVQLLLDAKCDIAVKDIRNKTAHSYAVSNKKTEVLKLLEETALAGIR